MSAARNPNEWDDGTVLVPDPIRARLRANGAAEEETDPMPVVKFFNPCGAGTWIVTAMLADGDTLYGLADLGFECPELGTVSLTELRGVRLPYGLGIERDLHFRPRFTLRAFAEAAIRLGRITEDERALAAAARRLGLPDNPELPPDFTAVT